MNLAPTLGGLTLAAVGVYMLLHARKQRRLAQACKHWPSTTATLTRVHLWSKRNIDGEMREAKHLSVAYTFDAQGETLTGHTVAFEQLVYPETVAFAEAHPEGSTLPVSYNPAKPAENVLLPMPPNTKPWSGLMLSGGAVLLGCVIAFMGYLGKIG